MKSENLSKHCAKSRTLNNEINQKLRDEVYSLILQEMSTLDNFISRKIKVVYHRNYYRKYTSKQNCSGHNSTREPVLSSF
jgi:hypothetical protein